MKPARQEFSRQTRRDAFLRAEGRCENTDSDGTRCSLKLGPGNLIYDHIIPWEISRDSSLGNCQCLCKLHDKKKYSTDRANIDRAKRVFDGHIGAKVSRTPMPCGRKSQWKKRMDGSVVRRSPNA